MINALAPTNPLQDARLFVLPLSRDEGHDRFADDFFWSVTEEPFSGCIPTGDVAIQVFADNGVIGIFDDGRQPSACFLATPSVGNVAKVGGENLLGSHL